MFLSSRYEEKAFDSGAWETQQDVRYAYVNDLIENNTLGMDGTALTKLLGTPDYTEDYI
ncbi:MAG: hypothetical protein ACI9O4_001773 [Chitinophagales bacterium]